MAMMAGTKSRGKPPRFVAGMTFDAFVAFSWPYRPQPH
jgi:hypothetical protein